MFKAPSGSGLPHICTMLDDLSFAAPRQIAAHLGLKESTLATYRRTGNVPRSVALALFWETQWGRSAADAEGHNFGVVNRQRADGLELHAQRMAGVIWRLEAEIDLARGSTAPANLPLWRVG